MPELPEVEVVRRGLVAHVVGHTVTGVRVIEPRSIRRGTDAREFEARLTGVAVTSVERRGKYLWVPMDREALVIHLGMSGQCVVVDADVDVHKHTRIVLSLENGQQLRFIDQRMFGGMSLDDIAGGVPSSVAHIARDPFDEAFDVDTCSRAIRAKRSGIKRVLLDQSTISGVGNIYADEALWRARLHYAKPADRLTGKEVTGLLGHVTDVMGEALAVGGTSFDALYVNVNGASGYFSRELAAYGCEGEPCARCGSLIVREPFMNRSSFRCPTCQRPPRRSR